MYEATLKTYVGKQRACSRLAKYREYSTNIRSVYLRERESARRDRNAVTPTAVVGKLFHLRSTAVPSQSLYARVGYK